MGTFYFSPYQIATMAMSIEEAGATFYEILSNSVDARKLKDMFIGLSKAELQHKDAFSMIADSFHHEDMNEYAVDVAILIQDNLNQLKAVAFNIRNQPNNLQEALDIAIHTEKEAIHIYTEMQKVYIDKFHPVLSAIIKEEKIHLEKLIETKI
jgi:rubrerythrin